MTGFRKDRTTAAQTAANSSAQVTAALVTAGVITDADEAMEFNGRLYAQTFSELGSVVEQDNEMFAKVEAEAPKSSGRSGGSRKSGGSKGKSGSGRKVNGVPVLDDPGSMELKFGAFKGLSLYEVYDLDGDQCADYGYPKNDPGSKSGRDYVLWVSKNEDENAEYARAQALAFLEDRRASSDEE